MDADTEQRCRAIFAKPAANWTMDDYRILSPLLKTERNNLKLLRLKVQLEENPQT